MELLSNLFGAKPQLQTFYMAPVTEVDQGKLHAASADRNVGPIGDVLATLIHDTDRCRVLEIGSGTGQHAAALTWRLKGVAHWQPTDYCTNGFHSVRQYAAEAGLLDRIAEPVHLSAQSPPAEWTAVLGTEPYDVVLAVNVVHVVPWYVTEGLLTGAAAVLRPGGHLVLYGPFARNGILAPDSNVEFDTQLKLRNEAWGIRDIHDIATFGAKVGLKVEHEHHLPAHNMAVVLVKQPPSPHAS